MADGGKFGFEIEIRDGKAIADLNQLSARLKDLDKTGVAAGAKVGTSFATMAKSFVAAAGGALVLSKAWGALTSLGRTALKNAAEQVEANAQLEYMYGANAAALIKQASALQIVTKFGDDQIQNAQFALGTFKLTADAVEKLTPAILDLAQAKKMDATAAANLLGKAMVGNIGLLGRYGIALNETQKQILQTGTEEQKVALITSELGSKFGGVAEAMNKTVPGAVASLKKAFGEVLESQGMLIQGSEKIRVGIQSVANQMYTMGGNAELAAEQTDKFAMSIADTAIVSAESLRGIIGFAKTALNVVQIMQLATPAGIMAAGGNLRTLTLEIGENIKDAEKGMDDYGGKFVEVLRNARAEMAKSKGGVIPVPRGMPGGASGAAAGGKGAAEKQAADELAAFQRQLEVENSLYAGAFDRIRDMRVESNSLALADAQAFAERSATFELEARLATIRQWESAFTPSITSMAEFAGDTWMSMTSAVGQGVADLIVDGTADAEAIAKGLAKELISSLASLAIQVPMWLLIRSAANTVSTGIVAGYTAALVPLAAQVAMWKSIEYSASVASFGTAQAAGAGSSVLGGALGGGGGILGGLFHDGGMIDRYHSGGTIPRAHSGMYMGRLRRDEVPIIAQTGEAVLNRAATRRIGGRRGVDALNRGQGIGGGINITINASPGQSPQAIADSVGRELMRRSRRGEIVINARGVEQ